MLYSQQVTLTIKYDPETESAPEEWDWPDLLDVPDREHVTIDNLGPITVEEC